MDPSPKVITGPLHADNKGACHWGHQGFLAYGCHGYTVVVDPKTLQIIQTVGPQKGIVTDVRWSGEDYHHAFATGSTYCLHLASADTTGAIVIWDVTNGQIRTELLDAQAGKQILGLEWVKGHSESHDLVMVLHNPDTLELWDAFSGVRIWKKSFTENLLSFTLDPFDLKRLILLSESPHILVCTDVSATREPSDNYTMIPFHDLNLAVPAAGSRRKVSTGGNDRPLPRSSSSLSKMASLATNMILNTPDQSKKRPSVTDDDSEYLTSCIQAVFSPAHQHLVLLVFASEIQIIDVDVEMVVSTIRLDKSSPNFTKIIPCETADVLFCLHENGSASLRVRKQTNTPTSKKPVSSDSMLDLTYELRCQSDSLRLLRHSKVFSFNCHPITEKHITLLLSDSRVIILDVMATEYCKPLESSCHSKPKLTLADVTCGLEIMPNAAMCKKSYEKITLHMVASGLVSGVLSPITIATMMPAASDKHAVGMHVAVGSDTGVVQLVNVYSGQVEYEYKLFMAPVRGIEWVSHYQLLVFSYPEPPSYGNRKVKSEIVILNTKSGETFSFYEGQEGKGPILMAKMSPSRRYVVVMYRDKAMEFWNVRTRQLAREIVLEDLIKPVYVTWYNYSAWTTNKQTVVDTNGRSKKVEKKVIVEQMFITGQMVDNVCLLRLTFNNGILNHEFKFPTHILFGPQSGKVEIVCMTWQGQYLVLADRAGQLYIANGKALGVGAMKIQERRGSDIRSIQFAPGKMNTRFMVQYMNICVIWELVLDNFSAVQMTSSPPLTSDLVSATWVGPESVVMATQDGCLHVLDMCNNLPNSPITSEKDDFFHVKDVSMKNKSTPISKWKLSGLFSPALLEPKLAFLLKYSLQTNISPFDEAVQPYVNLIDREVIQYIQDEATSCADRCYTVAKVFGDEFDIKFWQLVKYCCKNGKPDQNTLRDITKQLDISDLLSQTAQPETANLIDLPTTDLDTSVCDLDFSNHGNTRSQGEMDLSWLQDDNTDAVLVSANGDLMKNCDFKVYETSKLVLHNRRRSSNISVKEVCSRRYIMTNKVDMAVQVLMETDTENAEFKSDCLKACLSSCVQQTSTSLSTIKLAATHLIAAGHLDDGAELLCLIDRRLDACKYLISYGKWQEAVWLAKTSLKERECLDIMCKWADHLWQKNQKSKAVLVMLSQGQYVTALQMLCELKQYDTAALFLQSCLERGLVNISQQTDCVYLEFAKLLMVTGYQSAVEHYCHMARDRGDNFLKDLRK